MLEKFHLFPEQASTVAPRVDALFYFLIAVSVFFVLLIAGLILYFMVKYRRRRPDERGSALHGSLALEVVWTAIPFAIALVAFFWGASIYAALQRPPDDALEVHVVGKQWMWKLQHPEGHREINELHVPIGRPVKLLMTTEDVLHSFFIPDFRVKKDVVPGMYTSVWFTPTKTGKFHLYCAEYCGNQHSGMIGWVHVMEPADYEAWLAGVNRGETMAQAGERLFSRYGCASCHKEDNSGRCPTLKDIIGTQVQLANGGRALVDEAYLRESILKPNAKIVAGYTTTEMPTFQGQLNEDQVLQLIAFIKAQTKQQTSTAAPTKGGKK